MSAEDDKLLHKCLEVKNINCLYVHGFTKNIHEEKSREMNPVFNVKDAEITTFLVTTAAKNKEKSRFNKI